MKISLLLMLTLAACMVVPATYAVTPTPAGTSETAASPATLERYDWQLHDAVDHGGKRLDALLGQPDKPLQLDFISGRIHVRNACNSIGGSYLIEDGHLDVTFMMQSMLACRDPTLMQRESTIKAMLRSKPTLVLSHEGATPLLTLTADDGTTLTFAGSTTQGQ